MTTARRCPACGDDRASEVVRLVLETPDGHPLQGGYAVVSCETCGTGFADAPDASEYYERHYREQAKYATEGIDEVTAGKAEFLADRLARVLPPGARVADLGCGAGALVAALRRRGLRSIGVDPAPQPGAVLGSFSAMPADLGHFDAVCVTGVLEHLWDTAQAMTVMRAMLRPGGLVLVAVPDAARYLDPLLAPFEDFNTEHVNHFSRSSLERLARRFGLATVFAESLPLEVAPGHPAAHVVTIWRMGPGGPPAPSRGDGPFDAALRESLLEYADRSSQAFAAIDLALSRRLAGHEAFSLWGAGELTPKLLALPALARRRLLAVVDANTARRGLSFRGLSVEAPEILSGTTAPVVVASLIRSAPIAAAAEALGLPTDLVVTVAAPTPSAGSGRGAHAGARGLAAPAA